MTMLVMAGDDDDDDDDGNACKWRFYAYLISNSTYDHLLCDLITLSFVESGLTTYLLWGFGLDLVGFPGAHKYIVIRFSKMPSQISGFSPSYYIQFIYAE